MTGNPTFVRFFQGEGKEKKEFLVNISMIWKVEVKYFDEIGVNKLSVDAGATDPTAMRGYNVFVGNEVLWINPLTNDAAVQVIRDIYKHAVAVIDPPTSQTDAS
jgi:hypothetical protein